MAETHIQLLDEGTPKLDAKTGDAKLTMIGDKWVELTMGGVTFRMAADRFMRVAGAVRGRLCYLGMIPTEQDPPMAIGSVAGSGQVMFTLEAPVQHFNYSVAEAKKLWREIRKAAENAQQ